MNLFRKMAMYSLMTVNGTNLEHSAQACVLARDTFHSARVCAPVRVVSRDVHAHRRMRAGHSINNEVITMEETKPKSSMAKFRRENRRHDYFPIPQAQAAIERLGKAMPDLCTRELIDTLVLKGEKAFFPDAAGANK